MGFIYVKIIVFIVINSRRIVALTTLKVGGEIAKRLCDSLTCILTTEDYSPRFVV